MKRTSAFMQSDTASTSGDLSVLRKPITTSVNGLNEARKAYEDGTDEVRKLLSNECDIIYECKVCRNLFRSLANFISHKRVYCKTTYCSSSNYDFYNNGQGFSQDISTIVQAEGEFIESAAKNSKNNEKDLSSIIERLIKREQVGRLRKLSDFYEQVNKKLTQDEILQKRHVLHLDVVPESNVAIYQTVKGVDDTGDSIKSEIIEIQEISDKSRTVLGLDGKVISPSDLPEFPDDKCALERPFECEICKVKFATEKTLKLHIETKHITSTYVFQCPSCSKTFLKVGQVIRHLTNDHKKSMRRVRLMRNSISKRRTRIDEVQVKGPNRELARLKTDKDCTDLQNDVWHDNLENGTNSSKNVCLYCGRQFDRRAVLFSHHKVCKQKNIPNTRPSFTKKVNEDRPNINNSNGWNGKEFDDSSNSNSLDSACLDTNSVSALKEKSNKSIKNEAHILDGPDNIATNRRKRRSLKAIVTDAANQSADEKPLNVYWAADENVKIKEENLSPIDETNVSDSGKNITNDDESQNKDSKTEDTKNVKTEKRTRGSSENVKLIENKTKPKLSSNHCKYCFKKFSNASNLRRHITMSHFGPKEFSCNLCTFRARRKIDILGHMRLKHDGERSDILNFVTINDEPEPKPSSSVNRRKEKHTEVLRDDEEEMFIDSDSFILEENTETTATSVDMEKDATDLLVNESVEQSQSESKRPNLKRKGRPKSKDKLEKSEGSTPLMDQKERYNSLPTRRPVRNRIMPVKKDFVYDYSTLLKKEYKDFPDECQKQVPPKPGPSQAQPQESPKCKNPPLLQVDNKANKCGHIIPNANESSGSGYQSPTDDLKPSTEQQQQQKQHKQIETDENVSEKIAAGETDENKDEIKGAAKAMAQQAVQANRAVFSSLSKLPDLPIERPGNKSKRQFDTNSMKDWPILKRTPSISDGFKSKLSNIKVPGLRRRKRSCLLKHSYGINYKKMYDKHTVAANGHIDNRSKCNDLKLQSNDNIKISTKLVDKIQLRCAQINSNIVEPTKPDVQISQLTDSDNSLPSISDKQQTEDAAIAPRRMTLLERLAENKTKKLNESLSRMTIANSDNDSDED